MRIISDHNATGQKYRNTGGYGRWFNKAACRSAKFSNQSKSIELLNDSNIHDVMDKLEGLQACVDSITEFMRAMQKGKAVLKDWIDQDETMRLTSLKKSALYELRKSNRLTSSKIGKKVFYRLSDIERMLDENEKN